MPRPNQIVAFDDFFSQTVDSRPREVLNRAVADHAQPFRTGTNELAAEEIQGYLETIYSPAVGKVVQSFDDHGLVIDCMPIAAQPGAVDDAKIAKEPGFKVMDGDSEPVRRPMVAKQMGEAKKDPFGNQVYCPPGFVPVPRVTPERILGMGGLANFLQKAPDGGRHPTMGRACPQTSHPAVTAAGDVILPRQTDPSGVTHAYAHAAQHVQNMGGQSWLNVWRPAPQPGVFSLSQQWFTAGSGPGLQTIEGGWHVYPNFYNEQQNIPRIFIFFTPDGYQSGAYNLMSIPNRGGFVQTNNTWTIGGSLKASVAGGDQMGFLMQWQLYQGDWWLYLGTSNEDAVAVGYYPSQVYGGGAVTRAADTVDFGGEVCSQKNGRQTGQMGSGKGASLGWQGAAFQSIIRYFDTAGNIVPASLTPDQRDSDCYTIDYHTQGGADWETNFFFGGASCNF